MLDDSQRLPSCSIGRAMEILGERWTLLILRECFYGVKRFSVMQRNLGIARNILSARLQLLVRSGILERRRYQDEPERFEYKLTEKGLGLYPAVVAIMRWGDEHLCDDGEQHGEHGDADPDHAPYIGRSARAVEPPPLSGRRRRASRRAGRARRGSGRRRARGRRARRRCGAARPARRRRRDARRPSA